MADLISQPWLTSCLAGLNLSAATQSLYPQLTAAASRAIRRYCNRAFNRQVYDELYTLDPGNVLLLKQVPVNAVERLCTNPTTVLAITNTNASLNQRATAALLTTGNVDIGLTVTGVTLTRYASGAKQVDSVAFTANMTISALATAIAAVGGGWSATPISGYELWPAADLRQVQGALPALSPSSAELQIHVDDVAFNLDELTGEIFLDQTAADPFSSIRFGPYLGTDFGDLDLYGGPLGIRCVYDAGYDTVPEEVQQATVEVVKAMIERLTTDTTLVSESIGVRNVTALATSAMEEIPTPARAALSRYKLHRA